MKYNIYMYIYIYIIYIILCFQRDGNGDSSYSSLSFHKYKLMTAAVPLAITIFKMSCYR